MCNGPPIKLRWDRHHELVLEVADGRVWGIVSIGPRTTYDEGLC